MAPRGKGGTLRYPLGHQSAPHELDSWGGGEHSTPFLRRPKIHFGTKSKNPHLKILIPREASCHLSPNWALLTSFPFWNIAFILPPPGLLHWYITVLYPAISELLTSSPDAPMMTSTLS